MLKPQMRSPRRSRSTALLAIFLTVAATFLGAPAAFAQGAKKVAQLPIRTDGPKTLDPVRGSTVYDNIACSQIYETLLEYKYLVRPEIVENPDQVLQPLLLEKMPDVSADGLTYHFTLKKGVVFHDDACFANGKGRGVVPEDWFYSWKRQADDSNLPKGWWLFEDQVVGFDEYRTAQNAAAGATNPKGHTDYQAAMKGATGALAEAFKATSPGKFNYDAPVTGFKTINQREFDVVLKRPIQQFKYKLAMFQTSVVPREAVEKYGVEFGKHAVGTGPYLLDRWEPGKSLSLNRNPAYHECFYPSECDEDLRKQGYAKPAGTRLPILDRIEYTMFVEDAPMWQEFESGKLGYTEVPSENFKAAINERTKKLRATYVERGITHHRKLLLDVIFDGFNMDDPVVGGYTPEKKALRQAISLAFDYEELNQSFYNGTATVFDGVVPPGLAGYPKDGRAPRSYRGPNLEKAKELLAKAGYPGGKDSTGAQLVIAYYTQRGGNSAEQTEMRRRQLAAIDVKLDVNLQDFSTLIEGVQRKACPMFSFAWGSDYPDAENNLALLYGPNETPGSNSFNYKRAEYDEMYRQAQVMPPGPARTALYSKMRDMAIEDVPFCGSMARTREYLVNPWLKNLKPTEDFYTWYKFLDVDDSKR